ncbi:MAG: glycogen synthase, partial [Bryobacteraceae bacterium]
MTRVLMVASEAAPLAKTGGLADVTGALPAALESLGDEVAVLLPRYRAIPLDGAARLADLPVWLGGSRFDTTVWRQGRFLLLDCPPLYDRDGIYGDSRGSFVDNHVRYAVLSRAALEVVRRIFRPQILHGHDWQAGLMAAYLRGPLAGDPTFAGIRTLLTIHNLGYQGRFGPGVLPAVGLSSAQFHPGGVEFHGEVSFLKAGIVYSDWVNTVSPTYAREIRTRELGFGLDGLLRARSAALSGILNGADYAEWDPSRDPYIARPYSAGDLAGKRECKLDLMREMGLE